MSLCKWCAYAKEQGMYGHVPHNSELSKTCECTNHRGSTNSFNKIYTNWHHSPF